MLGSSGSFLSGTEMTLADQSWRPARRTQQMNQRVRLLPHALPRLLHLVLIPPKVVRRKLRASLRNHARSDQSGARSEPPNCAVGISCHFERIPLREPTNHDPVAHHRSALRLPNPPKLICCRHSACNWGPGRNSRHEHVSGILPPCNPRENVMRPVVGSGRLRG